MKVYSSRIRGAGLFYILIALFPILPSYTRVMGYALYSWIVLAITGYIVLANIKKLRKVPRKLLMISIAVFALYAIPVFFHGQIERLLNYAIEIYVPILLILFVLYNDRRTLERSISILIWAACILSVFGLVEFLFSFNIFSLLENYLFENAEFGSAPSVRFGMNRIEQSFNTPLTYAIYLILAFGLAFYRYLSERKKIYLVPLILYAVNIILTLTRGITAIFLVAVCGMFFINESIIGARKIVKIILGTVLLVSGAFVLVPELSELFLDLLDSALGLLYSRGDTSQQMREAFQEKAFAALRNPVTLLFGLGVSGLRELVSIDNEWLRMLTGYGIIGLCGFAIIIFAPIVVSIKGIKQMKKLKNRRASIFYRTMFVSLIMYAVGLYTVAQMADARMFYIIMGITLCYGRNLPSCASESQIDVHETMT